MGADGVLLARRGRARQPATGALTVTVDAAGKAIGGESRGAAQTVVLNVPATLGPTRLLVDDQPTAMSTAAGKVQFDLPAGEHTFRMQ